jgi:hypothetical protein
MLADPQSLTYATVAKSLVRSSVGLDQSEYRLNDSGTLFILKTGHTFNKRNRCFARFSRDAYVSDPLVPANNLMAGMAATLSIDWSPIGLTATNAQDLAKALVAWATDATLLKLINGET